MVNSRCVIDEGGKKMKRKGMKKKGEVAIPNNDTVKVISAWKDGEFYIVTCDWEGHRVQLKAMENYDKRNRHLERLRQIAIKKKHWGEFFDASDSIADLRSATTTTAHCSQGSTYNDIFINLSNMAICRNPVELQRLLYVAITRAKGTVYITGALS